jgi:hypothetical protein
MSGSGFKMGLAIALRVDGGSTLIIVAIFFIRVKRKTKFSLYHNTDQCVCSYGGILVVIVCLGQSYFILWLETLKSWR